MTNRLGKTRQVLVITRQLGCFGLCEGVYKGLKALTSSMDSLAYLSTNLGTLPAHQDRCG